MSIEINRTCDICGKTLKREFAHVDVFHDDRTLVYYTGPNVFDLCPDCWNAGWEKLAKNGDRRGMDI